MKKSALLLASLFASTSVFAGGLISAVELNEMKDQNGVVVLDYRWDTVPDKTVPGAMAMQNKDISRTVDGVPGMILPKEEFETFMSAMGINNTDTLVLVDDEGMMNATRMWWVLKTYGHQGEIYVLDGQIAAWEKAGLPMEAPVAPSTESNYIAQADNGSLAVDLEQITYSYEDSQKMVIDTRSTAERLAGHIPGSVYIEWKDNLNADGTFKSKEELAALYNKEHLTSDLEWIAPYCKSAVRATHTMFALVEVLGYDNVKNYDGSWLEYGESDAEVEYGL